MKTKLFLLAPLTILAPNSYFNPIITAEQQWVISVEEMEQCVNPDFLWVKDLELIEYLPNFAQDENDNAFSSTLHGNATDNYGGINTTLLA
jgi:hypothetical protein